MKKVSVLLFDVDSILRSILKVVLESNSILSVIGEATTFDEAINLMNMFNPDIVIISVFVTERDGFDIISKIQAMNQKIKVMIFSPYENMEYYQESLQAGVSGYLYTGYSKKKIMDMIFAAQ